MNRFRIFRKAIPRRVALFGYVFIVLGPFLARGFATLQALSRGEFDGMGLLIPGGRQLALL